MLYMIVETFRDGDALPVYRRFRDQGRMAPDGVKYVASWVTEDLRRCFQVMECDDRSLLEQWMARWRISPNSMSSPWSRPSKRPPWLRPGCETGSNESRSRRAGTSDRADGPLRLTAAEPAWRQRRFISFVTRTRTGQPTSRDRSRNPGSRRPRTIAGLLSAIGVAAIYSSPALRSIQTVELLAQRLGVRIGVVPELRERHVPVVLADDFERVVRESWRVPTTRPVDGESNAVAQTRGLAAVHRVVERHTGQRVVVDNPRELTGAHSQRVRFVVRLRVLAQTLIPRHL